MFPSTDPIAAASSPCIYSDTVFIRLFMPSKMLVMRSLIEEELNSKPPVNILLMPSIIGTKISRMPLN